MMEYLIANAWLAAGLCLSVAAIALVGTWIGLKFIGDDE
jgi:hypothetical protein